MIRRTAKLCLLLVVLAATAGCQSVAWPGFWPFPERERSSYPTPAMRIDAVRQFASRSTGADSPEQREMTDQLARQMQIEPDPLVRRAVIDAIAEYRTPLAAQVLEAGLGDANDSVRVASCRALGRRGDAAAIPVLAAALSSDQNIDVRLAAAESLGQIDSPESMRALVAALDDRDPALQYAGVQSMKSITGQNFGGDVQAWRELAAGGSPTPPPAPSIAERLRRATRF